MQINFDWSSWLYVMITRHCILLKMQVPLSLFHFEICSTVFSMYIYFLQIQMNALLHHVKMGDLVWTLGAVTAVFVWTDGQEWTVPLLVTLNDYNFFNNVFYSLWNVYFTTILNHRIDGLQLKLTLDCEVRC